MTGALAIMAGVGGARPVHIHAAPTSVNLSGGATQSGSVTLSADGGVPPYAFMTTVDTADAINLTNAATATPTWGVTSMTPSEIRQGLYDAKVTDAIGQTETISIFVQFERP